MILCTLVLRIHNNESLLYSYIVVNNFLTIFFNFFNFLDYLIKIKLLSVRVNPIQYIRHVVLYNIICSDRVVQVVPSGSK